MGGHIPQLGMVDYNNLPPGTYNVEISALSGVPGPSANGGRYEIPVADSNIFRDPNSRDRQGFHRKASSHGLYLPLFTRSVSRSHQDMRYPLQKGANWDLAFWCFGELISSKPTETDSSP